jgi:hypothetical protein
LSSSPLANGVRTRTPRRRLHANPCCNPPSLPRARVLLSATCRARTISSPSLHRARIKGAPSLHLVRATCLLSTLVSGRHVPCSCRCRSPPWTPPLDFPSFPCCRLRSTALSRRSSPRRQSRTFLTGAPLRRLHAYEVHLPIAPSLRRELVQFLLPGGCAFRP